MMEESLCEEDPPESPGPAVVEMAGVAGAGLVEEVREEESSSHGLMSEAERHRTDPLCRDTRRILDLMVSVILRRGAAAVWLPSVRHLMP